MFRSLAARLTATYVFAAVVLVVLVVIVVTAFTLSMFGISAREQTDDVAALTPEVVRLEVARTGSLQAAAVSIVRELSRPGFHVAVWAVSPKSHRRRFLAASATGPDGHTTIMEGSPFAERPFAPPLVSVPTTAQKTGLKKSLDMPPSLPGPEEANGDGPAAGGDGFTHSFMGSGAPPGAPGDGGPPNGGGPNGPPSFGGPNGSNRGYPGQFGNGGLGGPDDSGVPDAANRRPYPFGLNSILHIEPRNVEFSGGRVGILPDPAPLAHAVDVFWIAMLPTGFFIVIAAWLLGRFITLQALRPLVETTESLDRFGAGRFHAAADHDDRPQRDRFAGRRL